MAWFRRSKESASEPASVPVVATDPIQRAPEGAWETAPTIQRTVGNAPTTFRTSTFSGSMPSLQNPSLSGSMGHNISDDGPAGVMDGLTTTIDVGEGPGLSAEGALPLRHSEAYQPDASTATVQRAAATWTEWGPPGTTVLPSERAPISAPEPAPERTLPVAQRALDTSATASTPPSAGTDGPALTLAHPDSDESEAEPAAPPHDDHPGHVAGDEAPLLGTPTELAAIPGGNSELLPPVEESREPMELAPPIQRRAIIQRAVLDGSSSSASVAPTTASPSFESAPSSQPSGESSSQPSSESSSDIGESLPTAPRFESADPSDAPAPATVEWTPATTETPPPAMPLVTPAANIETDTDADNQPAEPTWSDPTLPSAVDSPTVATISEREPASPRASRLGLGEPIVPSEVAQRASR